MAHDPSLKVSLRAAYLNGLSLEAASVRTQIPFETARKWKRDARDAGDDWDKFRAASLLTEGGLEDVLRSALALAIAQTKSTLEMLQNDQELTALQKVQANASLGDSLNKLGSLIRRLMPETDALAVKLQALRDFAAFVAAKFPGSLAALAEPLEAFGREVAGG